MELPVKLMAPWVLTVPWVKMPYVANEAAFSEAVLVPLIAKVEPLAAIKVTVLLAESPILTLLEGPHKLLHVPCSRLLPDVAVPVMLEPLTSKRPPPSGVELPMMKPSAWMEKLAAVMLAAERTV